MSRTRSPNYPAVDLATAIEMVEPVYRKEKRNKMPREVLAKHLGYTGLNGRSLGMIGALRAYGLLEGTGDDVRVTDDALILLNAPEDSFDRRDAMTRCALRPPLFRQLSSQFETTPSDGVIRYALIKMGFTPEAAGKATQTYLATISFIGGIQSDYASAEQSQELTVVAETHALERPELGQTGNRVRMYGEDMAPPGMRREVIDLDDGEVVITFPTNLTAESFSDLRDYLNLFLKKMERRAKNASAEPGGRDPEDGA